ncbi:MAG: hypothetical protein HY293_14050, partial [Planctomycetes bacterium]|nr:hypothetical protein [Planctomycetota bacterium]
ARKKIEEQAKEDAEKSGDKEKGEQALKDFQDLQKGKELLKRFPPDKYGDQTLKEVLEMGIRKQPVPPDIREFADPENQRLWKLALQSQKDLDKKKEEKKQ